MCKAYCRPSLIGTMRKEKLFKMDHFTHFAKDPHEILLAGLINVIYSLAQLLQNLHKFYLKQRYHFLNFQMNANLTQFILVIEERKQNKTSNVKSERIRYVKCKI